MNSLIDKIPFWHFDQDLMVFKDGSLGMGFKLNGFDITCSTNEEINHFSQNLETILLSANEGLKLQIFYNLSSEVDDLICRHKELSQKTSELYRPIAKERIRELKEQSRGKSFFVPQIYLFVRSQSYKYKRQGLFDKAEAYRQMTLREYKDYRDHFLREIKTIESGLKSTRLTPRRLSKEDYFSVAFDYLNFDRRLKLGMPSFRENVDIFSPSVNEQLCLSDLSFDKDQGLKLGDKYFKLISLKILPEGSTFASMIEEMTKLGIHFWISQSIHILNQDSEKNKLELQRRVAHSMASGSKNVSDLENESKLSNIEALLDELLQGSTKLLSFSFDVIVWGEDKKELDEKCDEVLKAFRSLNQAEGVIETLATKEAFLKSIPGTCEGLRHKKIKSKNIAHLMPMFSSWMGNNRPVCLIPNRDGALFSLDPFNTKELPNFNGLCFGGSGSGKSFTIAQLMLMFYGVTPTPRIIWIDNGASSKRLLNVLDGEFMDLKVDSDLCLNMFDLAGEKKPTTAKVKLILAALEIMVKDDDLKGLPKRHKALLEESIYQIYEEIKDRYPTLSDLREVLLNHPVVEMNSYGEILYSWTGDTAYGKMLDGQSNVTLSKDLVTIEVQSLSVHPELKNVLLLLLTSYIEDCSTKEFERPYLLIVDEAERLFQTELARQFVITCYRTWRKFNSGIWCLSQNYKDFMKDENLKDSLLPNASVFIVLRQRKIDWEHFQKTFDFNDAQVRAIKSLEIVKGEHSEFFLMQDERQTVLVLIPEKLSYWICTNDAGDKIEIKKMNEKYPEDNLITILMRLAYPERFKTKNLEKTA